MKWTKFTVKIPPMETDLVLKITKKYLSYEKGFEESVSSIIIGFFQFRRPFDTNPDKYQSDFYQICECYHHVTRESMNSPLEWKDFINKNEVEWMVLQ